MLFLKNDERQKGYEKLLLNYGIKKYKVDEEDNHNPILYMTNRR